MGIISFRQQVVFTCLLFILLLLLVPRAGYSGDLDFWWRWAVYIFEHRLGDVYQVPDNNYNPLYHYILWFYGVLMGSSDKIYSYVRWLKAGTLVFDFAGAFWAASLVPERSRRFSLVLLLLLNICYLYNTLLWIQVDGIYTFFSFGAVVLAGQRRPVASVLLFVLAIATKTQAIIFLPPLLLLWIPQWWHHPKKLVWGIIAGAALAVLILAPFIWWSWENYLPHIIAINIKATELYPKVSMWALNFWHLILQGSSPENESDLVYAAGLTYRMWGLLLFCVTSAIALFPLLFATIKAFGIPRNKPSAALPMPLILLSCGIIPLLFAFFNTQMHERYWHAAILFLAAYGFLRRDYLPYILASCAYFLNLESVFRYLQLLNYNVLLFQPWFVASLFAVTIILSLLKIYLLATPWRTTQPVLPALVPDTA